MHPGAWPFKTLPALMPACPPISARWWGPIFLLLSALPGRGAEQALESFRRDIQPVLEKYCYDCHGNGISKGGVTLDAFDDVASLRDHKLWERALRNVRTGLMPPNEEGPFPAAEAQKLVAWIKRDAFGLDPARPDPGRVTVRRLNRVEYRNTVRELTGVDYDTQKEFPADDTGHGFDNIGAVLTLSPMLLEKYLDAAQAIITQAVPTQSRVVAEHVMPGRTFRTVAAEVTLPSWTAASAAPGSPASPPRRRPAPTAEGEGEGLDLSYYTPATVEATHRAKHAGRYQVVLNVRTVERYVENQFDLNRCRVVVAIDGETVLDQEFAREGNRPFEFVFDREWRAGEHTFSVKVTPLDPEQPQLRQLRLRLNSFVVRGPLAPEHWVAPRNYAKYFPRPTPADAAGRREYAREVLAAFATRAFRRPVETAAVDRLVALAESVSAEPSATFESGVAQAMVAILASPSFIFREEFALPPPADGSHPPVDEYALASRLSYFLWSSMPDAELVRLASAGQLRANLTAQVNRLLRDPRSREFVRNFTGQWLQARDIAHVPITALDVFLRDHPSADYEEARQVFRRLPRGQATRTPEQQAEIARAREVFLEFARKPKPELTSDLRRFMREETELTFAHILKEDRSVLELLRSDYTFLNEDLARHYGIEGVSGRTMRKVMLPPDSPRGGILTQGTVLAVTSNPTRTSPVKRGVFILEAILGTPPAPPPPNIPSLEDVATPAELKAMSLRETLALHAKEPLCSSCHNRMDPLGLALENFNAMGRWRTSEMNQPIEPAGKLITGETFADIRELKQVLATARRPDFYYALAEKLLTYALGRGVEYYDTTTLDHLVAELDASGGRISTLLHGIVNSAPFQQRRATSGPGDRPPASRHTD